MKRVVFCALSIGTLVALWLLLGSVHFFRTASAGAQDLPDFINAPSDPPSMCIKPTPTNPLLATPTPKPTCGATRIATPSPTPDTCLRGLIVPTPMPGLHRLVQLVNCSDQTLLGTANAAQQKGKQPLPLLPRQGTWIMGPQGSGKNVLNIDIPLGWEDTTCPAGVHVCNGIIGPRFWARTGCSYDLDFDRALCETGACAGRYDCSAARLSASVGTTVSEWTFAQPVSSGGINYLKDSPDISAVDGANLNMDIQPIGGSPHDPFDKLGGHDIQWLAEQYPLTVHHQDLRADLSCSVPGFRLKRSNLPFVIVNSSGKPVGGDSTIACFSNCARYAYPAPPDKSCNEKTDHRCLLWKSFCLGDPSKYGSACMQNSQCPVSGSCWNNPGSASDCTCQGRAFIKNAACSPDVCTYPYGYIDPLKCIQFFSTQPPFGHCSDVTSNPAECIGDDTLHKVMPKAYTWPNDPQVYGGDANTYRVIFAPGNTTQSITQTSTLLMCNNPLLKGAPYHYETQVTNCSFNLAYGAQFGVAFPNAVWACDLDPTGSGENGVVCKWPLPSPAPPILQIGMRVNFNQAATVLQLGVNPSARPGDLLLATITFNANATPTAPPGWTPVPKADVTSLDKAQRTTVWYHFVKAADPTTYTWKWNGQVNPAGAITSWRGVDPKTPFDATALTMTGAISANPDFAIAPSIKTATANARLLSIYGAGGTGSSQPAFALPVGNGVGDETGAAKINVLPTGKYYAHLVGDRIESKATMTAIQKVQITQQNKATGGDWTAISMALRPAATGPTATPSRTPTRSPTRTPTPKRTPTPTRTPSRTATRKPTPTP